MEDQKSILHELYVFSEWKPEPEYIQKPDGLLPENISGLWRWLKFFGAKKSLIDSVAAFKEYQQKWQIALGDQGKVIAVLTDNIIEIRTKRSDYATIAARTTVSRDAYTQWRRLVWSPDCSFLALAYGNGVVSFFDLSATNLFNIPIECSRPGGMECTDATHAVAEIIFMPLRVKDIKWNWEVLIITYDGKLRGFLVSQTDGFKLHHSYSFTGGVGAVAYSAAHSLLYVAGVPFTGHKDPDSSLYAGLTAWRILNDDPFYKLSVVSDQVEAKLAGNSLFAYFPSLSKNMAFIINMVISPDGSKLACIHCTGDISVWRLPVLKLLSRWPLLLQPQHDLNSPLEQVVRSHGLVYYPAYIHWWNDQDIIVSRFSGAVSVCDVDNMENILGKKPEFMQGVPQVTGSYDGTFLALECESETLPAKKSHSDESMEVVKSDEIEEGTLVSLSKELIKSVLYAVTDLETFQPRPKRITVLSRIYRLLGIKSTTPADLLARKIAAGKYKEALILAKEYNLDKDLVFQQQWRKTHVSSEAIKKYLSKVSQKTWAVHQCVDRLPETSLAATELLKFGLELTNEEILRDINKDREAEDQITKPDDIRMEDLNAYTSELLRCRYVMFFYKERLKLYEEILKAEKSSYNKDEYHRLRTHTLSHSALQLAREGRIAALTCLWGHFKDVNTQLEVLEKIPETINPLDYRHLLPLRIEDQVPVGERSFSEQDWCRKQVFRTIWSSDWSADTSPQTEQQPANNATIAEWYEKRAEDIERQSGLVSHAITMATLADEMGFDNKQLMFLLETLDSLVYDVFVSDITLMDLRQMDVLDVCKLMMTGTTLDTFVADIKKYMVPYLRRYEKFSEGLADVLTSVIEYLEYISIADLSYVLTACRAGNEFEMNVSVRLNLVERCLMAHTNCEDLDLAEELIDTIPPVSDGSISESERNRRVSILISLHHASYILYRHGAVVTIKEIKDMRFDRQQVQNLFTKVARTLACSGTKSETPASIMSKWTVLLENMLSLQDTTFQCITKEHIFEIHASALLTSGDIGIIRLADEVLEVEPIGQPSRAPVSRSRAIPLILAAAREYVNSAAELNDIQLKYAKCCLSLLEEPPIEVRQELDLIEALPIIQSFGVHILPIQVRICEDRMEIIEKCVESDRRAYLSTQKLLHLAKLLIAGGHDADKREGRILHLVCKQSLSHGMEGADVSIATALRLAQLGYGPAAPVLRMVAKQCAPLLDPQTRRHLLSAAATHLVGDLHGLLIDRLNLEADALQKELTDKAEFLKTQTTEDLTDSTDDEFADAVTTPIMEHNDFIPARRDPKKALMSILLKTDPQTFSFGDSQIPSADADIPKEVHFQEFYRSLYPTSVPSTVEYGYSSFSTPDPGSLLANALIQCCYTHTCDTNIHTSTNMEADAPRTQRPRPPLLKMGLPNIYLQNLAYTRHAGQTAWRALLKAGEELMYKDTPLAVACFVRGCNNVSSLRRLVEEHNAEASLVILLYSILIKCNQAALKDTVFLTKPIEMARSTLQNRSASNRLLPIINLCLDKLSSMNECERVKALGYSVNGARFNIEPDYRGKAIRTMARSNDRAHLELAMELAFKYSMDPLTLWVHHVGSAIESADDVHAAQELFEDPMLLTALRKDKERAIGLLNSEIWDRIPGASHDSMLLFFSLLKYVDDKILFCGLTANEHVKLLKKIKAASQELNYKLLITQPTSSTLTDHLVSIMRPDKVGMLTKLLRTLPPVIKLPATVNHIYTTWLSNYFFNLPTSNVSSKKWMQQFRQCVSFFNKMSWDDLAYFLTHTCFSAQAVDRVPAGTRNLMIMQAVDYCQQEHENDLKMFKNDSVWSKTGQELTRWARFLENFHSSTIQAIIVTTGRNQIWTDIEMSQGLSEKVRPPLCRLVMETEMKPATLTTVLQCLHLDVDVDQIFIDIANQYVDSLDGVHKLMSRLTVYYNSGVSEELLQLIVGKGMKYGLPPHKQIALLSLSQKQQIQDGDDMMKVINFSVDLFRSEWADNEYVSNLTVECLESGAARRAAFLHLLPRADTWLRRKALCDVITCWPEDIVHGEDRSLQCEYLHLLLTKNPDHKESLVLIKLVLRKPAISEKEVKWLEKDVNQDGIINFLWILLLSKNEALKNDIPRYLLKHKNIIQTLNIEDDLVKEMLDCGVFLQIVSTPIYSAVVNYILNSSSQDYDVTWAVSQLLSAKFLAEAGHIKLLSIGAPYPLRGFNESIKYLTHKHNK